MKKVHGADKSAVFGTVGGPTTEEKNPGQKSPKGLVPSVTVGRPTTDEKNPGQQSAETSPLQVPANSVFVDQPKKRQRKQQLVARTE